MRHVFGIEQTVGRIAMQRGRSVGAPVAPAVKLAIPKPLNLPSLRKVRLLPCEL